MVLPSRVRDYQPSMLDELTTSGEVLWSGRGELPGGDGWVSLHLADAAPLTLTEPNLTEQGELHGRIIDALAGGGAFFFRQLSTAVGLTEPVDDKDLAAALWDLVWAGLVGNDTLAPLRARLGATTTRARATPRGRTHRARARVASTLAQSAPPTVAGRWSLLPAPEAIPTVRSAALAETLLERHGIVTRGAVVNEGVVGGFALAYKILSSLEETGRTRRGYFVEGLGAAQFATPATVDRLRTFAADPEEGTPPVALTLGATDPANPYGAALAWPQSDGHRAGRKAGALVVLVDGSLEVYVERGGKTVLTFTQNQERLRAAAASLAEAVRRSGGRLRIEKVNGEFSIGTPFGDALAEAGFAPTPQGMRLRA
jgi:ATP-dependent Lhr-like helicase